MKREEAKKLLDNIDLVKGIAEGKQLQWKLRDDDKWNDFGSNDSILLTGLVRTDSHAEAFVYRVKPEVVIHKSWVTIRSNAAKNGQFIGSVYGEVRSLIQFAVGSTTDVLEITTDTEGHRSAEFIPFEKFKAMHKGD